MSSFLCSPLTISVVTNAIIKYHEERGDRAEDHPELYEKVLSMNLQALDERYGEDTGVKDLADVIACNKDAYEYDPFTAMKVNKFAALKRIHCYLYQCSEGSVINSELYKEIDNTAHDMAYNLISDMPEYEKADAWQ